MLPGQWGQAAPDQQQAMLYAGMPNAMLPYAAVQAPMQMMQAVPMQAQAGMGLNQQMVAAPDLRPTVFSPVSNARDNAPCNTLFVGNLGDHVSEVELRGLFAVQPGYRQMKVVRGRKATVAFVEFADLASAILAHQTLHAAVLPSSDRGGIRVQYSKNPFGQRGLDASGFPGAGLYVGNGGAPSGALYVGAGATAAGNMLYNPGGGDRVAVAAAAAAAFGGMPPGLAPVDLVTGDAAALMNVGVASASMALPQMMGARQVMGGAGGAMQVVGGPRMAGMQPGGPNAAAGTGAYLGGYGGGAVQQAAPAALAAQPQPQLQGPPQ